MRVLQTSNDTNDVISFVITDLENGRRHVSLGLSLTQGDQYSMEEARVFETNNDTNDVISYAMKNIGHGGFHVPLGVGLA